MSSPIYKIDRLGNYGCFPGVTTIASCYTSNKDFCTRLYQSLNHSKRIKNYFSLLPASSFHMTTLNLYTEYEVGSSHWPKFLDEKLAIFQKINERLKENEIEPVITIKHIHSRGVIQLLLSLEPEQEEKLREIGREFGLSEKVPSVFHITLAYQFKCIPPKLQHSVHREISSIIKSVMPEPSVTFKLSPPKLTTFFDMTSFHEWDLTHNPFHSREKPKTDVITFFRSLFSSTSSSGQEDPKPSALPR